MSEPLDDTWARLDLPVLREVVRLTDKRLGVPASVAEIAHNLGLPEDDVVRAGRALASDDLITTSGRPIMPVMNLGQPTGEARRRAGAWPTPASALDRMVAALEQLAEHADDPDTRSRAQKIRDALVSGGTTIGLSVATAAITGQIPGQ